MSDIKGFWTCPICRALVADGDTCLQAQNDWHKRKAHEMCNPERYGTSRLVTEGIPAMKKYNATIRQSLMDAYTPGLPTDSAARKGIPLATGCLDYFPDALAAVAELSFLANDKHNPGEPMHWARGKSADHPDCLMRHFMERGKMDGTTRHSTAVAWRALAILQLEIEAAKALEQQLPPPAQQAKR